MGEANNFEKREHRHIILEMKRSFVSIGKFKIINSSHASFNALL